MGVVYLAEDVALNRRVALKFIRGDRARRRSRRAAGAEPRAASALDHPNVATIYEVGEWQGRHFIAMAWYNGETLADRIGRGPALDRGGPPVPDQVAGRSPGPTPPASSTAI